MSGIQKYLNGENPEIVLIDYLKALKLTFSKYDLSSLNNEKYFTSMELVILNNIALVQYRLKKTKVA